MFYDLHAPWPIILHKLLNGCGHLWFLPMIFWCFVICYSFERSPIIPPIVVLALGMVALFLPLRIPMLGVEHVYEFFFYFYLGFAVKRKYVIFPVIKIWWPLLLLLIASMILCICNEMIIDYWSKPTTFVAACIRVGLLRLTHLLCALSMILFLYSIANRNGIKHWLDQRSWLITLSGYCYGVYIYQQFILNYLYYDTPFTKYFSSEIFPWLGFLITLVLSLGLCHLTLKTRWGRYLIG